jgi:hypothetical protein
MTTANLLSSKCILLVAKMTYILPCLQIYDATKKKHIQIYIKGTVQYTHTI